MPVLAPGIFISHDSTGVTKGGKEKKWIKKKKKTFVWKLEKEGKVKEKIKIYPQKFYFIYKMI